MRRGRRRGRGILGLLILVMMLVAVLPMVAIETGCRAPGGRAGGLPLGRFGVGEAGYARPAAASVLSYPDWYIIYARRDMAALLEVGDQHSFPYRSAIAHYWTGLCAVSRAAGEQGGDTLGAKARLSLAGIGFSVSMAIDGVYETIFGRVTAAIRGRTKTSEDLLAQWVAGDYAAFVGQWPWYQYSFGRQVRRLWGLPLSGTPSLARSSERRLSLTLGWGARALVAQIAGMGAGLSQAPRAVESVVGGIAQSQLAAIPDLVIVRSVAEGKWLVRTPRYDGFTRAMLAVAASGGEIYEVAGNDRLFVTVRAPDDLADALPGSRRLFDEPIRVRPGWRRVGEESPLAGLAEAIRSAPARGVEIEHLYDY